MNDRRNRIRINKMLSKRFKNTKWKCGDMVETVTHTSEDAGKIYVHTQTSTFELPEFIDKWTWVDSTK